MEAWLKELVRVSGSSEIRVRYDDLSASMYRAPWIVSLFAPHASTPRWYLVHRAHSLADALDAVRGADSVRIMGASR